LKPLYTLLSGVLLWLCSACGASGQEADHEIHEQLRGILREVQSAINSGQYDRMLPLLAENVEATSITQEVMANRGQVSAYFREWFGPSGYMKSLNMTLEPDGLTELSADKSWGLVRGNALEHYEAKDGDQFDFKTRWTAVLVKADDNQWRLRAIHFGTNQLDNPVLTKVRRTLTQYAIAASCLALLAGLSIGWIVRGRRMSPP
jgi:ketosteroid isomerase-like protein